MISLLYCWRSNEEIVLTRYKAIAKETELRLVSQLDIFLETSIKLINKISRLKGRCFLY